MKIFYYRIDLITKKSYKHHLKTKKQAGTSRKLISVWSCKAFLHIARSKKKYKEANKQISQQNVFNKASVRIGNGLRFLLNSQSLDDIVFEIKS